MLALKYNYDLSNTLKKRFLYYNDINSVNILINMFESEENIRDLYPQYISMGNLTKTLRGFMRGRPGNDLASRNLSHLIHDDINRFELLVYLEGYKLGTKSVNYVNGLEKIILKNIDVEEIYNRKSFFQTINKNENINSFKEVFLKQINEELQNNRLFERLVNTYTRVIIRPKLNSLNHHLDLQIKMGESMGMTYLEYEGKPFTKSELTLIYKNIRKLLITDCSNTFADAYWQGLLEKLLNRYR